MAAFDSGSNDSENGYFSLIAAMSASKRVRAAASAASSSLRSPVTLALHSLLASNSIAASLSASMSASVAASGFAFGFRSSASGSNLALIACSYLLIFSLNASQTLICTFAVLSMSVAPKAFLPSGSEALRSTVSGIDAEIMFLMSESKAIRSIKEGFPDFATISSPGAGVVSRSSL